MHHYLADQIYHFNFLMIFVLIGYHRWNKRKWTKNNGTFKQF